MKNDIFIDFIAQIHSLKINSKKLKNIIKKIIL